MHPIRVLLVDDESELVSTLAERLELRGFETRWFISAEEALHCEDICTFEVAVLDVKLPKINGLELKKRLQGKCPSMKFIFLTGHGSGVDFAAGAAEAGAMFYLVKPVQIEALVDKIHKAVQEQGVVK
ncbi:MAG: response regulator [Pseudomonadota bacterium]